MRTHGNRAVGLRILDRLHRIAAESPKLTQPTRPKTRRKP